jgi:predicted metal-binding protein
MMKIAVDETAVDIPRIEGIIREHGYPEFRWIRGQDVPVRQWVRFKCMFGCNSYGRKGACPPQVPSVDECRRFFDEYTHIAVIHITGKVDKPEDRVQWSRRINLDLLKLERAVFLADHPKAFLLFMDECHICKDCTADRTTCVAPSQARPGAESLAVDVYATVRGLGFPIHVLTDYQQEMNRYAFLLVA